MAADTITFSVHGTITLSGALMIGKSLDIEGPGARHLTISGDHASRSSSFPLRRLARACT